MFETFADIWKDYLTYDAYRNLSSNGYYHMLHPGTNLRIISTFSLVYDTQNWYTVPNHTDPLEQLLFMEQTLDMCEKNGEIAHIIGHIPPGDVFTLSKWSTRFRALVNRYTNILRGQYYGHTHYDEFKNIKSYRDDELSAGTVWATGSFTAYPLKNPGLRIWELDPDTWHIWNYEQHRMYITEANNHANLVRKNSNYTDAELKATGEWEVSYKFREYYGIDMDFNTIAEYIEKIKDDDEVKTKVITMMHGEGPDSVNRQNEQYWTY
jgi:sphingomyelin phosphodiesterase